MAAIQELPEMPNGPLLELHGQRKRFHVPHGLKPLLEDITREVLRYQPDDIYSFLSKNIEVKLAKREEEKGKKAGAGKHRWNSLEGPDQLNPEELMQFLEDLNISKDEADQYATKIQAVFRGHKARKSLEEKGQGLHKDHRKSWEWKKWSWEGPSLLNKEELDEFLVEHKVDLDSANKYATKIQAVYRGHAARKSLVGKAEALNPSEEKAKRTSLQNTEDKPKRNSFEEGEEKAKRGSLEGTEGKPKRTSLDNTKEDQENVSKTSLAKQSSFQGAEDKPKRSSFQGAEDKPKRSSFQGAEDKPKRSSFQGAEESKPKRSSFQGAEDKPKRSSFQGAEESKPKRSSLKGDETKAESASLERVESETKKIEDEKPGGPDKGEKSKPSAKPPPSASEEEMLTDNEEAFFGDEEEGAT